MLTSVRVCWACFCCASSVFNLSDSNKSGTYHIALAFKEGADCAVQLLYRNRHPAANIGAVAGITKASRQSLPNEKKGGSTEAPKKGRIDRDLSAHVTVGDREGKDGGGKEGGKMLGRGVREREKGRGLVG